MPAMPTRTHLRPRLAALVLLAALAACDTVELVPPATPQPSAPSASAPLPSLARGLALRAVADDSAAADVFAALLDADPRAPDARAARLYLAESLGRAGRWPEAAEHARPLADAGPADELHARALFLLARAHEEAGAWADADTAYARYRALATPLAPYASMRQAAVRRALGRLEDAASGYEAAAAGDIARLQRAIAYEQAIALRVELGQPARALELYRELLGFAEQPAYRAPLLAAAAALAAQQGQPDQARAWLRAAVAEAPATAAALDAAAQLLADPQGALAPADAARVFAAHERWDDAVAQFDAAIVASDPAAQLAMRRERALALRALGRFDEALAELAAVGAAAPDGDTGRQAQLDWVQTLGQSGDVPRAIAGYQEFAAAYPDDPRAPEALRRAVTLLEGQGDAAGAASQRLDFARRYPAAEGAARARFLAGVHFFDTGRPDDARAVWDELRQASSGAVASQATYWAARAASGDPADAPADMLDAARDAAPDSYYAARASELLGDHVPGDAPLGQPVSADEWRAADQWLAAWSGASATAIAAREETLAQVPAAVRAVALADVGLTDEAIGEWRAPLEAWRDDPLLLYHAARAAYEGGVTYVALNAAERLVAISPAAGTAQEPAALRKLIYPTPYRALVTAQARTHGIDPLALYALLRQESHFNPAATSWVGARGLAQVMPATAQGIAADLGVADFHQDDLYRPEVSVRFGAYYLRRQLDGMSGSLPGALAAYNGGAGNAWRWAGGDSVPDPDLFVERIDFEETRGYVKLVYGYYDAYRRLYRPE